MSGGNAGNLNVQLKADVAQFLAGLKKAQTAIGGMEKRLGGFSNKAKETTRANSILQRSVLQVSAAYGALAAAQNGMQMAKHAAATKAAAQVFEAAGGSLEKLRKQTNGMISDANLVKKANLAETMGIARDDFAKLAKIAQASAIKTGQSMDWMFDSVVTGTARQSRLILDNLGLIVSSADANARYAAGAKKAVSALTELEKQQAFTNEVIAQGEILLAEVGDITETTYGRIAQLETQVANLRLEIGEALIPVLENFIWALKQTVPWFRHLGNEGVKAVQRVFDAFQVFEQSSFMDWFTGKAASNALSTAMGDKPLLEGSEKLVEETKRQVEQAKKALYDYRLEYDTSAARQNPNAGSLFGKSNADILREERALVEALAKAEKKLEYHSGRVVENRRAAKELQDAINSGPPAPPYKKPERPDIPAKKKGRKGPKLPSDSEVINMVLALNLGHDVGTQIADGFHQHLDKGLLKDRMSRLNAMGAIAMHGLGATSGGPAGQLTQMAQDVDLAMTAAAYDMAKEFEVQVGMIGDSIRSTVEWFTGGGAAFAGKAAGGIASALGKGGAISGEIAAIVELFAQFAPATAAVTEVLDDFMAEVGFAINPIMQGLAIVLRAFMPVVEVLAEELNGALGPIVAHLAFTLAGLLELTLDTWIPALRQTGALLFWLSEGLGRVITLSSIRFNGLAVAVFKVQTALYDFAIGLIGEDAADILGITQARSDASRQAGDAYAEMWQSIHDLKAGWESRAFDRMNQQVGDLGDKTEGAAEAMGKLNDELLNAPTAFKIQRYRADAAEGAEFDPGSEGGGRGLYVAGNININARDSRDIVAMLRDPHRLDRLARGESSGLSPFTNRG